MNERGLGRKPSPFDARDWKAGRLLALKAAGYVPKSWECDAVLDQDGHPYCVGYGVAGYGNCAPVDDQYTNADGDALYREACAIGGYPDSEDGAYTRDGLKALRARGRIAAYAALPDVNAVAGWLANEGSVVVGTDWHAGMFDVVGGYVVPNGPVVGGHCYLLIGVDADSFTLLNSWGIGWGDEGRARIRQEHFAGLLEREGEAWAAVELPLDAPVPVRPTLWQRLWAFIMRLLRRR